MPTFLSKHTLQYRSIINSTLGLSIFCLGTSSLKLLVLGQTKLGSRFAHFWGKVPSSVFVNKPRFVFWWMMERWSKYNAFFMFFESHCTNLVRSSVLVYLWTSVRSSEISSSTQHYLGPFGKSMWSSGCWDRYRHKELWHIPDYTVLRQIPKKVQFEKDSKTSHFFSFSKSIKDLLL